jgi:hydrogenase-4 component F
LFRHIQPMVYGERPEGQQPVAATMWPVMVHMGLVLWLGISIPGVLSEWFAEATELIAGVRPQ